MTERHHTESGSGPGRKDPHARRVRQEAQKTKETLKQEARRTGENIRQEARHSADRGKRRAADELEGASRAAERSAEAFREEGRPELGDAMGSLADGMERFARRLRNKDMDQLLGEARDAARHNPMLFYGAAATAGFLAARLMTAQRRPEDPDLTETSGVRTTGAGGEPYRTAGYTPMGARSTDGSTPATGAVTRSTETDRELPRVDEEAGRLDPGLSTSRSAGSASRTGSGGARPDRKGDSGSASRSKKSQEHGGKA